MREVYESVDRRRSVDHRSSIMRLFLAHDRGGSPKGQYNTGSAAAGHESMSSVDSVNGPLVVPTGAPVTGA